MRQSAVAEADLIRGAALLVAGFTVIPLMDAAAKELAETGYAPVFVAWLRFAVSAAVLSPLLLRPGAISGFMQQGAALQVLRAVMLATATVLFFSALKTMPMADALAVYFIYPFLITLMAPALLGETVGIRRLLAVLVGFCGSLLIVRPGFQEVPAGVYYVLAASVCFALFNVLTRKLSGRGDPWLTVFWQSLVGAVVLAVFVPANWAALDMRAMILVAQMIVAAIVGHWLLVRAYEFAPASLLAPFGYFEMIAAVAVGFIWFGDFPDPPTWAGIAVIVATGVYIWLRERKHDQRVTTSRFRK